MPPLIVVDMAPHQDDDPSAYADLPTSWPHDADHCVACNDFHTWVDSQVPPSRDTRVKVGHSDPPVWLWESRLLEDPDYAVRWPKRYRALIDHRNAVRRARQAAR